MAVKVDINLDLKGTEKSDALLKRMTDTLEVQRRELEALNKAGRLEGFQLGEKEVTALTRRLAGMSDQIRRGANETDDLVSGLRDVAKQAKLVEENAERAGRAVRSIPSGGGNSRNLYQGGSGSVGDVAGDIGSVFSSLGSTSKLGVLSDAGDFGDLFEGLFRLRGSAQELAGAANAAAAGSTAAAGGLTAIVTAAAPFVAVAAAIGATLVVAKIQASEQQEELQKLVKVEDERIESFKRQQEFLKNLTLAENKARFDQNQALIDEITASRDALVEAYAEAFEGSNAFTSLNQIAKAEGGAFKALDLVLNDSLDNVEQTRVKIEEYNQQLDDLFAENASLQAVTPDRADLEAAQQFIQYLESYGDEQERLNELIQGGTEAVRAEIASLTEEKNQRQANIRDAIEARQQFEEGSEAYQELTRFIEANQDANAALSNELQKLRGSTLEAARAVDEQAQAAERAAQAVERAKEEFNEAAAEFERLSNEAAAAGQEVIKAQADVLKAENAIAETQAKRAEDDARREERARQENAILDQIDAAKQVAAAAKTADNLNRIRTEGYTKEQQITASYLSESAKALQEYNKSVSDLNKEFATSELRATEDYNLQRFRLARDLEAGLFEAARNNDVSSFITQRNRGVTQLGDQATDFGIERRRAGEDQQARLADLREGFEAERAERANAAQISLAQVRREMAERIAAEQGGAVVRITEEQRLQQQLIDLRAMHNRDDEALRRAVQDKQLRDEKAYADARLGIAQQTAVLANRQAADAGTAIGLIMINSAVSAVNQYRNLITSAMLGGAGGAVNNFSFGNITVGNGVSQNMVQQEVQQGVQASINQLAKAGQFIFSRK